MNLRFFTPRFLFPNVMSVPKPLRSSVQTSSIRQLGSDERGKPIRLSASEVREVTEQNTERMTDMDDSELTSTVQ